MNTKNYKKEKVKETEAKMDWEIDYSEFSYALRDESDNEIKPFILIIVHPESYFIIDSYLASSNNDYLQEFLDRILSVIKNGQFIPGRILIKKKELFDLLSDTLKKMDVKLEMVKRTKTVESIKKDMENFFKNR